MSTMNRKRNSVRLIHNSKAQCWDAVWVDTGATALSAPEDPLRWSFYAGTPHVPLNLLKSITLSGYNLLELEEDQPHHTIHTGAGSCRAMLLAPENPGEVKDGYGEAVPVIHSEAEAVLNQLKRV